MFELKQIYNNKLVQEAKLILHPPSDRDYPQVTMWIKNYNTHSKIKFWHVRSNRNRIAN